MEEIQRREIEYQEREVGVGKRELGLRINKDDRRRGSEVVLSGQRVRFGRRGFGPVQAVRQSVGDSIVNVLLSSAMYQPADR